MGLPLVDMVNRLMQAWDEVEECVGDAWRAKMENR